MLNKKSLLVMLIVIISLGSSSFTAQEKTSEREAATAIKQMDIIHRSMENIVPRKPKIVEKITMPSEKTENDSSDVMLMCKMKKNNTGTITESNNSSIKNVEGQLEMCCTMTSEKKTNENTENSDKSEHEKYNNN